MQRLHAGCSKAEPNIFTPPQTPFPGTLEGQNLIIIITTDPLVRIELSW